MQAKLIGNDVDIVQYRQTSGLENSGWQTGSTVYMINMMLGSVTDESAWHNRKYRVSVEIALYYLIHKPSYKYFQF